jgi:two-component system, LytTR family, response regulator
LEARKTISMAPVQFEQTILTDDFPFVFVRADNNWLKIALADILYLKSDEHYVQIVTEDVRYTLATSLTACEQKLPPALFKRVHRSYIVNVSKIDKLSKTEIFIHDQVIPLARAFADTLFQDFVWARLLG